MEMKTLFFPVLRNIESKGKKWNQERKFWENEINGKGIWFQLSVPTLKAERGGEGAREEGRKSLGFKGWKIDKNWGASGFRKIILKRFRIDEHVYEFPNGDGVN